MDRISKQFDATIFIGGFCRINLKFAGLKGETHQYLEAEETPI